MLRTHTFLLSRALTGLLLSAACTFSHAENLVVAEYDSVSESDKTYDGVYTYPIELKEGASYSGERITIYRAVGEGLGRGIYSLNGYGLSIRDSSITIDALDGSRGIFLREMQSGSFVENTVLSVKAIAGTTARGMLIDASTVDVSGSTVRVEGDMARGIEGSNGATINVSNTGIELVQTEEGLANGDVLFGIAALTGASVTVTGGSTITAGADTAACAMSAMGGTITAEDVTINIGRTGELHGVINASTGGTVILKNSTIISAEGNRLLSGNGDASANTIILDNVDLSQARSQVIHGGSVGENISTEIILRNGTDFDGLLDANTTNGNSINLTLEGNASWTMTGNSDLGGGTLTVGSGGILIAGTDGNGDFLDLNNAVVMLEEGGILQIDKDSSEFTAGGGFDLADILGDGATLTDNGGKIVTNDGYLFDYDGDNEVLTFTGDRMIPEPSTAVLGLFGLASVLLRRRGGRTNTSQTI